MLTDMTCNADVGYGQIDIEIFMGLHNRYIILFQCLYDGQRYSSPVRKKKGDRWTDLVGTTVYASEFQDLGVDFISSLA